MASKKVYNQHVFNIKEIKPRNENQTKLINVLNDNSKKYVFITGPSGVGKTLLPTAKGVEFFNKKLFDKIVITRPTITAGEKLGYLPGTIDEKMEPWVKPIFDIIEDCFSVDYVEYLVRNKKIEIVPIAYMRGLTLKNAWIIADEMQNSTPIQMKLLLTRLGENSRMIINGDLEQNDHIKETSGFADFLYRYRKYNSNYISIVDFTSSDVERHPAIKDILHIYGEI